MVRHRKRNLIAFHFNLSYSFHFPSVIVSNFWCILSKDFTFLASVSIFLNLFNFAVDCFWISMQFPNPRFLAPYCHAYFLPSTRRLPVCTAWSYLADQISSQLTPKGSLFPYTQTKWREMVIQIEYWESADAFRAMQSRLAPSIHTRDNIAHGAHVLLKKNWYLSTSSP